MQEQNKCTDIVEIEAVPGQGFMGSPFSLDGRAEVEVKKLYLDDRMLPAAIARKLNVPEVQVKSCVKMNKWNLERTAMAKEAIEEAESDLAMLQADTLVPTATRQINVTQKIEEMYAKIIDQLDVENDPEGVAKRLASICRALSCISPIGAKASGLEVRTAEIARSQVEDGVRKQPLIMIGVQVRIPEKEEKGSPSSPIINVTSD